MREVDGESRVVPQSDEVVVVVVDGGACQRDLLGLDTSRGQQLARPADGLDRLVVSRGCADDGRLGFLQWGCDDLDGRAWEPLRHVSTSGHPLDPHVLHEPGEECTPHGGDVEHALHLHVSQDARRMDQPLERAADKVVRRHEERWQVGLDGGSQPPDGRGALGSGRCGSRVRVQVEPRQPDLAKGSSDGADGAWQPPDRVEIAERGGPERSSDGVAQGLVVYWGSEATCQAGGGVPDRRDVEAVDALASSLELEGAGCQRTVGYESTALHEHVDTPINPPRYCLALDRLAHFIPPVGLVPPRLMGRCDGKRRTHSCCD